MTLNIIRRAKHFSSNMIYRSGMWMLRSETECYSHIMLCNIWLVFECAEKTFYHGLSPLRKFSAYCSPCQDHYEDPPERLVTIYHRLRQYHPAHPSCQYRYVKVYMELESLWSLWKDVFSYNRAVTVKYACARTSVTHFLRWTLINWEQRRDWRRWGQ